MFSSVIYQDDRREVLAELNKKREELHQLEAELEKYRECDPEVVAQMREESKVAKEAANRWTGEVKLILKVIQGHTSAGCVRKYTYIKLAHVFSK